MPDIPPRLSAALADRYAIERQLGEGGMATVYLAHDVKHDRKVALKVLRPELAAVIGADRFLAEIKTTANLQHPHILALHDSGEVDGTVFYVMPFVEGESLRDRLKREKQLAVADAVRIAKEIADALDYAHRHGVIHRDIKPENILLHDGRAVVADFGIALAAAHTGGERMTETGMSLGTPHYMSPEQAMGERDLDARSDVYALGCVLHEMLAGEPPFTGPTPQSIVAKVMTDEPQPIGKHRKTVPAHVEGAVLTSLEKLPADRFATAAEFAAAVSGEVTTSTERSRRDVAVAQATRRRLFWPTAFAAAVVVGVWGWLRPRPEVLEPPPTRLAVVLPTLGGASTALQRQIAITPGGDAILFSALAPDGNRTMRMALEDTVPTVLPGVVPFLSSYVMSPDGREFLGMVAQGQEMYRYPIGGGSAKPIPREIIPSSFVAWAGDGTLWFSANTDVGRGIARLTTDNEVTRPFGTENSDLVLTQVLPGNRTALTVRQPQGSNAGPVELLDLETGAPRVLLDIPVVEARYTAGYLAYVLPDGTLEAVPFDPDNGRIRADPVVIARGVSLTNSGIAQFAVAANGTVAYLPEAPRSLVLVDRSGNSRLATEERRNFHAPMFSPDGRRISVDFNSPDGRDVWLVDRDGGFLSRATFDRDGHDATWTPDGQSLTYTSSGNGPFGLFRTRPGNPEPAERLISMDQLGYSGLWLSDGSAMVTVANSLQPGTLSDIAILGDAGRGPVEPLVASRFVEQFPALSPDDRWLAFTSDQSGQNEVYLRPLRGGGDQLQVSLAGGSEPVWSANGRELFYRARTGAGAQLVMATIQTEPEFVITSREALFSVADIATATPHSNYDISPDGETFAMVRFNPATRVMVIQNLPALVRKLGGGE